MVDGGMMGIDMKVLLWWVAILKQQVTKIPQMIKAGKLHVKLYCKKIWREPSVLNLWPPGCRGMVAMKKLRVLSIQPKFQFEVLEISHAQWNSTFRLHSRDVSHHAFGHCSCKQDTKEQYWGQQFCQMVQPTEMTRLVNVDHLQSWSRIFRSDQTEMVRSIRCTNQNFCFLIYI